MFLTLKICCSVHEFKLFLNLCKLFLLSNNWTGCSIMSIKRSQLMWCVHEIQNVNLLWLTVIMSPQNKVWETYCVCSVSYYLVPKRSFGDFLFLHRFLLLLLLWLPSEVCELIVFARFLLLVLLMSGDVLLFYVSFSLLLLFLFLFFHTFLSARFLGNAFPVASTSSGTR
jgi:hypothetical protein